MSLKRKLQVTNYQISKDSLLLLPLIRSIFPTHFPQVDLGYHLGTCCWVTINLLYTQFHIGHTQHFRKYKVRKKWCINAKYYNSFFYNNKRLHLKHVYYYSIFTLFSKGRKSCENWCSGIYRPICANDGSLFSSKCMLDFNNCLAENRGESQLTIDKESVIVDGKCYKKVIFQHISKKGVKEFSKLSKTTVY